MHTHSYRRAEAVIIYSGLAHDPVSLPEPAG